MKITLLVFSDFPDGAALGRRTYLLSRGFAELGHDVHVIVAQRFKEGPAYEEFDGLKVHWGSITTHASFHRLTERLKARWAVYRIARRLFKQGIDWLILVFPELDRLPYLLLAKRHGARVISTYEDYRCIPPCRSLRGLWLALRAVAADKIIPRLTDLNLATSRFLQHYIRSIAARTPVILYPPIVDTRLFIRQSEIAEDFRSRWKIGKDVLIAYLGTYWYVEGLSVLLAAASLLKTEGLAFKLVISGKAHMGFPGDDIAALVDRHRLADVVVETGWLPTGEVIAGMSAADILVVPKLNHPANIAGMPAKLAEYLAMGSAVVASRVGDIPLYLTDHEDALLCEPGNPISLADRLRLLIHDSSLRASLANKSRATAVKYFDYQTISKSIETAISQFK